MQISSGKDYENFCIEISSVKILQNKSGNLE